jgi:hypothetical protein
MLQNLHRYIIVLDHYLEIHGSMKRFAMLIDPWIQQIENKLKINKEIITCKRGLSAIHIL